MQTARVKVPPHIVCVVPGTYRTLMGVMLLNPTETGRCGIEYVNVWSWDGTLEVGDIVTIEVSLSDYSGDEDHYDFAAYVFVVKNKTTSLPEGVPIHRRPERADQIGQVPILTRSDEERKTPAEWLEILHPGETILDPDGWRADNMSFHVPLTEKDFERRRSSSTIRPASRRQSR